MLSFLLVIFEVYHKNVMTKIIKIVFYNTLVLVFLLSIVEAIFGGWFKKII